MPMSDFHKISRAEGPKRTDEMRRPVSRGMRYAPSVRRARSTKERRVEETFSSGSSRLVWISEIVPVLTAF
jgi:hypothetical protein